MGDGWALIRTEIRSRRRGLALGVSSGVVWALARVAVPLLVSRAIDRGISGRDQAALWRWTAGVVAVGAVAAACAGGRRYLAFREARAVEASLRARLFAHLQHLDFAFFDRASVGDLMSRSNSDLLQIQNFLNMVPITIGNGLQVVAVVVIMVLVNPLLALCALGALPAVHYLGRRFSQRLHPYMAGIQVAAARVAGVVEETVAGARVVKGLGAEPTQQAKLETEAAGLYDQAIGANRTRARFVPAIELIPNAGLIAVVAVGGHQVLHGALTLGELVAFNVYVSQLTWPLRSLGFVIAMGQRAVAAADRVAETFAASPTVADPPAPATLPASRLDAERGAVVFRDVAFAYPSGGAVLEHFDLAVAPGETVALVGATGSGKSTVGRLLARFYDIDGGAISLDGVDIRTLSLAELRRAVAVVFEETFLFTDTVEANIAFARPDAPSDAIERAMDLAGATEFVGALPHGLQTRVGERGYTLSGGQRQRLALARALVSEPRVLVLDDATSAIDPAMEREIRDALQREGTRPTTLVITHRPATIALADRVVLIDRGRVAASGNHEELLATSARYRDVLAAVSVRDDVADAANVADAAGVVDVRAR